MEDHKLPRSAVAPARWGRHSSHTCEINIELHLISHLTQVRRYMIYIDIYYIGHPPTIDSQSQFTSQSVPSATFHCQWKQVKRPHVELPNENILESQLLEAISHRFLMA